MKHGFTGMQKSPGGFWSGNISPNKQLGCQRRDVKFLTKSFNGLMLLVDFRADPGAIVSGAHKVVMQVLLVLIKKYMQLHVFFGNPKSGGQG
jgi:hypothetical protein